MKPQIIISNTSDGNMTSAYGEKEEVISRRNKFLEKHGIPSEKLVFLKITNRDKIVEIDEQIFQQAKNENGVFLVEADAVITKTENLFIFLNFADCVPFIAFDEKKQILAFAHLGWQSTNENLQAKIITYFIEHFSSSPKDIKVYMGPSIKKESNIKYRPSQLGNPLWDNFITPVTQFCYQVDLNGVIIHSLEASGVPYQNIQNSSVDTARNSSYFSCYRSSHKKEKQGRFLVGVRLLKREN